MAVNGAAVRDQLDYRFQTTDDFVALDVIHAGEPGIVEFEKPIDEPLGIEFEDDAFDGTRICNNTCFFCFLKGLPKGLRKPLYVKDDDYRLSFLHGKLRDDDEPERRRLGAAGGAAAVADARVGACDGARVAAADAGQPASAGHPRAATAAGADGDRGAYAGGAVPPA